MSTKTEIRQTSAEIKKQIQEATSASKMKEAVKGGSLPLTAGVVAEINASESSTPEPVRPAESKPDQGKPAAEPAADANAVDLKEWAKKRGIDWTTEESVLSALRKSDQEFHKRQAEKKATERNVPPGSPVYVPPQPPAYPNGYSQPAYVQPQNPRQIIEELARQANMTPEDFERVARVSREVYEAAAQADRMKWQSEMDAIKTENQKNSVFRELSADPVFRNPNVAVEFHNVLEQMQASDPTSFEKDPNQYKRAYERAVFNIGRRNLEGQPLSEGVSPIPSGMTPPSKPPREFGKGSGGGYNESESGIDPKEFAKASLEDKRKILEGMGLRPSY